MKYIDAEKLKAELDEHYRKYQSKYMETRSPYTQGLLDALDLAEQVIIFLQQEQPEVDFKIKERKWVHDAVDNVFPEDGDFMSEVDFRKILKDTARHFYELGLKARKEE